MITEMAHLSIDPARSEEFEEAVCAAAALFREAPGCLGLALEREIEDSSRYALLVEWETVEAHTQDFRSSRAFAQWRSLIAPFLLHPPTAVHLCNVVRYF